MRAVPVARIKRVLRDLGFEPSNGDVVWADASGRTCSTTLDGGGDSRPIAHLFALGQELERKRVIARRDFMDRLRDDRRRRSKR